MSVDATAQLPDEVLCHVFGFLSLKDKLRSEAVNHKFQRCIIQELKDNPQPLKYSNRKLNGYPVPPALLAEAVKTLAKKSKFSGIQMSVGDIRVQQLDPVLSQLISEAQCLTKVTSFVTYSGCSQAVLEDFLDGCEKLLTLKLIFNTRPPNIEGRSHPLDLGHLLKNRRLVELELHPVLYPAKDFAELFKQILQPNTLRKLDLWSAKSRINLAKATDALALNGSVLEQIHLVLKYADVQFAPLFESLARLPALSKCNIECRFLQRSSQVAQFADAVTSLFGMSHVDISVTLDVFSLKNNFGFPRGCQFVTMIRQIQKVHPSMAVDIEPLYSLTLSLGNASIYIYWHMEGIRECGDDDCALCPSFYPSFLHLLRLGAQDAAAESVAAQHLPNWQVDRCKLGKVVNDLNMWTFDPTGGENPKLWRALSVEENEEEQSITISFETDEEMIVHHLFSITVSCGQCLALGCGKCVD